MTDEPCVPRHPKTVAVVGAGPAGLMAAERLAAAGCSVVVHDRMPSVARKFLLAGRGGLNLAHSEPTEALLVRYGAAGPALAGAIESFPADALRAWSHGLGQDTFVGSSGRVFPKCFKTSPLLRAWLRRLGEMGVRFELRRRWTGWGDDGALTFDAADGPAEARADATILALGGASWPKLGADGGWTAPLCQAGVAIAPFEPANCGFAVRWSAFFAEKFAGEPIKRAAMTFEGVTRRGEAMATAGGIEGGLVYAFSAALRDAIGRDGTARPTLDLRPDLAHDALALRLAAPRGGRSLSTHLRKAAALAPVGIALIREAGAPPDDPAALAARIKAVPLTLVAPMGLDRAISTAGGVRFSEIDERYMLVRRPGVFVAGEMLDWEAPTGGYLLQATFATAVAAADGAKAWLSERREPASVS